MVGSDQFLGLYIAVNWILTFVLTLISHFHDFFGFPHVTKCKFGDLTLQIYIRLNIMLLEGKKN